MNVKIPSIPGATDVDLKHIGHRGRAGQEAHRSQRIPSPMTAPSTWASGNARWAVGRS